MTNSTAFKLEVNNDVNLSAIRATDLVAFVRHLNERDIYDGTSRIPHPYTKSDARRFLRIVRQAQNRYGHPVHFAIRDRQGELIGACGYDNLVHDHCAEIGYWLAKPYWSRGIMTDVVRVMCRYAIDEWNLVRIAARVFESNTASARVLIKNGFRLEGLLRKAVRKDGRFVNTQLYSRISE